MIIIPDIIESVGRNKKTFSISTKLYEQGIVTLFDEIDDDIAYNIITQLLYLDTLDTTEPVKLYINTPGGVVTSGLAIIDTIEAMTRKVDTIGMGSCASMGAMILLCGTGTRKSLKSNRIMLHSVSSGFHGTYHDHKIEFKETEFLQNKLMGMVSNRTNMDLETVIKLTERDAYLSASESLELGLIDAII